MNFILLLWLNKDDVDYTLWFKWSQELVFFPNKLFRKLLFKDLNFHYYEKHIGSFTKGLFDMQLHEVLERAQESKGSPLQFVGMLSLFYLPCHGSVEEIHQALDLGVSVKMIMGINFLIIYVPTLIS